MPSPVGHLIAGVAVAWTADLFPGNRAWRIAPADASWFERAGGRTTVACALIAAAPDLDLLIGGHRTWTHGIGTAIFVGIFAAALAANAGRPAWRVGTMCAAAYASHIFLDWMGVDIWGPRGLKALWPFSGAWYISGWDVFLQTERRRLLTLDTALINARALVREITVLMPIAFAIGLVRIKTLTRLATEVPRGDHAAQ
jgi:hypothetical protein